MKRYLVFYGHEYYPSKGLEDLKFSTDCMRAAIERALELQKGGDISGRSWTQVWDTEPEKCIFETWKDSDGELDITVAPEAVANFNNPI